MLHCIQRLATDIHLERGKQDTILSTIEAWIYRLFSTSMTWTSGSMRIFEEILDSRTEVTEDEYETHLFGAAIVTHSRTIIERCVTQNHRLLSELGKHTGSFLFAPLVDLATRYGDQSLL